jgi:hypothetical protein
MPARARAMSNAVRVWLPQRSFPVGNRRPCRRSGAGSRAIRTSYTARLIGTPRGFPALHEVEADTGARQIAPLPLKRTIIFDATSSRRAWAGVRRRRRAA